MTTPRRGRWAALTTAAALVGGLALAAPSTAAEPEPLTNLAHLDFLLDTAAPSEIEGHTTYRLAAEPDLTMPWTYADARPGGTFERVGGGTFDPSTNTWGQGAYNADDVSRAAVVYLRDWQLTGSAESRATAYELLRALAYFQTVDGPNAGNVVLWMQPDGTLNPSAEPVELPDPSDSDASYWLARTLWAFGEGYAAFEDEDPEFAAFLRDRLTLAREAVDRQVLDQYGTYVVSDGLRVPAWLIVDGADASAEAVIGLSAYVTADPDDDAARETTRKLAEGIAAMGQSDTRAFPYGAILPWAQSRSIWHAWASQMPAALAVASTALATPKLLAPAVRDSVSFTPTLLTAGGADNGWMPTPTDRVQIAYGVDSRVQSLLAVAEAGGLDGLAHLAAMQASWYFGANRAGEPMYDPATGITFDGLAADGTINRNSGAESTIHGLLTMIALDARPEVSEQARALTSLVGHDGLTFIEAETATSTTGTVETPAEAWTGESLVSGSLLNLQAGQRAVFDIPAGQSARTLEPVSWRAVDQRSYSRWSVGILPLGVLDHSGVEQGISPAPGVLLPQPLVLPVSARATKVTAHATMGTVSLDTVLVRPVVSRLVLSGGTGATELVHATGWLPQFAMVGEKNAKTTVQVYDAKGRLVHEKTAAGTFAILLPAGGFAIATR